MCLKSQNIIFPTVKDELGMSSLCSVSAALSHACSGIAGPGKRLRTEFFAEKRKVHTSEAGIAQLHQGCAF